MKHNITLKKLTRIDEGLFREQEKMCKGRLMSYQRVRKGFRQKIETNMIQKDN